MKKYLLPLLSVLALAGCGEPDIPEHFGVFARLTNGNLVKLERASNVQKTGMVFFGNRSSIDMMEAARAQKFNYILEKSTVTLDMNEVEGFIVFGEGKVDDNVKIKYFADALSFNGKFFDNKGEGAVNESTYLDQGTSCGLADGALNKKINENMYLFTLPKAEKTDYKFCSLTTFKEVGKGTRKSPHVAVDFYGWYYDGTYWTFNVEGEDSKGKEKEAERQELIAKRIEAEKAEIQRKKDELKSYDSLSIVSDMSYFSTPENILAYTSREKRGGLEFKVKKTNWVRLGAFYFLPSKEGLNEFEYDELLENFKSEVQTIKEEYSKKPLLKSHVRLVNLELPVDFSKRGWFTMSYDDIYKQVTSKMGIYEANISKNLKMVSEDMSSSMSDLKGTFVLGTKLDGYKYSTYNQYPHSHSAPKFFIADKSMIRTIGKANGGKDAIEEVTLKYDKTRHINSNRNGTNSFFQISSFKLKSMEGRFILTDDGNSTPYTYKAYNVKPKEKTTNVAKN